MLLVGLSLLRGSGVSLEVVEEDLEVEAMLIFAYHAVQKAFQAKVAHQTVGEWKKGKTNPQKMMVYIL